MASETLMTSLPEKIMKESPKAALHSKEMLEEELFALKDELVDNFDQYFMCENENIAICYPSMDLIHIELPKDSSMRIQHKSLPRGWQEFLYGDLTLLIALW